MELTPTLEATKLFHSNSKANEAHDHNNEVAAHLNATWHEPDSNAHQ